MKEIVVVGKLDGKFKFDNIARVYGRKGIAPTISCYIGGGDRVAKELKNVKTDNCHR
jgi:hypothetical protein